MYRKTLQFNKNHYVHENLLDGKGKFSNHVINEKRSASRNFELMKLPNRDRAHIGDKLKDYALNPLHPRGKHKARKFKSVLGITIENSELLSQALFRMASTSQEAIAVAENEYGRIFELQFSLSTDHGRATISSVWIIRREENFPRLVTCFIV